MINAMIVIRLMIVITMIMIRILVTKIVIISTRNTMITAIANNCDKDNDYDQHN